MLPRFLRRIFVSVDALIIGAVILMILAAGICMMFFGCTSIRVTGDVREITLGATVTQVRDNATSGTLKVEKGSWLGDALQAASGLVGLGK